MKEEPAAQAMAASGGGGGRREVERGTVMVEYERFGRKKMEEGGREDERRYR